MSAFLQGGGLGIYGDVLFKEQRDAGTVIAGLVGPVPVTIADVGLAFQYALTGEGGKSAKAAAYRAVSQNIPFLNLFYIKIAFDYLIGFQIMETINPGVLKRVERRMKKDYNQNIYLQNHQQVIKVCFSYDSINYNYKKLSQWKW